MIKLKSTTGELIKTPFYRSLGHLTYTIEYVININAQELIGQLKHQGYGYSMLLGILKDYYEPKNYKIRLDKKIAFVKRHIALVARYFGNNSQYRRQLVHLARKELGYSPKTVDTDICASLIRSYNLINKDKT